MRARTFRIYATSALAFTLVLQAAPAPAGLDNSHHDVRYYLPDKDACLVCHSRKDDNYYGVLQEDLGTVGGQCIFLCHSGKGILPETNTLVPQPGPSVNTEDYGTRQSPDYTAVYFTRSHGRRPGNLKGAAGIPVSWPPQGAPGEGLAADRQLECTSCHSVHDNTYPPFLVAPLVASYPKMDGLCDRCHAERATNNLTGPPDGSHPVDFIVDNLASAARTGAGRRPRRILIQRYGSPDGSGMVNVFDTPAPSFRSLFPGGASWSMGGHLGTQPNEAMTQWSGPESRQQMGCYTCHSAHRTNENGEKNLVVVKTADGARGWNPLCVGCHGSAVGIEGDRKEWNVGVSDFGHPAGGQTSRDSTGVYMSSTGGFRFRIATPSYVIPQDGNRFGDRGELLCTTCHKIHLGAPGTMAIANVGQGTRAICKSCHSGVGSPRTTDGSAPPNSHHVTVPADRMAEMTSKGIGFVPPSWANPATGLGDISGGMDCADCHTCDGTAHNW